MNSSTKKNLNIILFLSLITIVNNLILYRPIFKEKMFGEPFDSRLQIVLHEHWWRWINGNVEFRNVEFFYPFKNALGFSDVFLVQGLVHSILRFIGFNINDSWITATIVLLIIGNLGWVIIAKKYINNIFLQILFIVTINSSLSFVQYFNYNPNIVGYSYISWLALLYFSIKNEINPNKLQFKVWILLTSLGIYALSCWYGAFFVIIFIGINILLNLFFNSKKTIFNLRTFSFKYLLIFFPIITFLVWLFIYVYVLTMSQPFRPIEDLIKNSLRINYFLSGSSPNGDGYNGSFFEIIYQILNLRSNDNIDNSIGDWTSGVGLFSGLTFVIIITYNFYRKKFLSQNIYIYLSILIMILLFSVIGESFSFFSFLYEYIPGFNSIRSPSRFMIFIGYFVITFIFISLSKIIESVKTKNKYAIFVLLIFIMIDQFRSPFVGWDRALMVNKDLESHKNYMLKNCDYFYYDKQGGWWYDQIEAITFSVQSGIPTVNGYSGAFPKNYPTSDFKSEKTSTKIFSWIYKIDKTKRGCFIVDDKTIYSLQNEDFIFVPSGFTPKESRGQATWQWAISPESSYLFVGDINTFLKVSFTLKSPECLNNQIIRVSYEEDDVIKINKDFLSNDVVELNLKFNNTNAIRLNFSVGDQYCLIGADPRKLFFEIKNLKIVKI